MRSLGLWVGLLCLPLCGSAWQNAPAESKTEPEPSKRMAADDGGAPAELHEQTQAAPGRPNLNAAAARRNENVQVNRIDNDGVKEANIRLGDNVTLIPLPLAET